MLPLAPALIVGVTAPAAAIGDAGLPFVECEFVFSQCESRNADMVLRLRPAIKLRRRRAHGKLPRGEVHHLRTLRAVPKRGVAGGKAFAGGCQGNQNGQNCEEDRNSKAHDVKLSYKGRNFSRKRVVCLRSRGITILSDSVPC